MVLSSSSPDGAAPHILAIDPDPSIRDLLSELLTAEGYRVSTHGAGADDDLAGIKHLAPDLIVLDDPALPSAWPLVQRLRMDPATHTIPLVLCTGAVHEVRLLTGHLEGLGVRAVLKPFDIDDLLAVIAATLPARDR